MSFSKTYSALRPGGMPGAGGTPLRNGINGLVDQSVINCPRGRGAGQDGLGDGSTRGLSGAEVKDVWGDGWDAARPNDSMPKHLTLC